jgi:hypothetical protein
MAQTCFDSHRARLTFPVLERRGGDRPSPDSHSVQETGLVVGAHTVRGRDHSVDRLQTSFVVRACLDVHQVYQMDLIVRTDVE